MNYKEKSKAHLIGLMNTSDHISRRPTVLYENRSNPLVDETKIKIKDIRLMRISEMSKNYFWLYITISNIGWRNYKYCFYTDVDNILDSFGAFEKDYKSLLRFLVAFSRYSDSDRFISGVMRNKESIVNIINKCRDKELISSIEVTKLKLMLL